MANSAVAAYDDYFPAHSDIEGEYLEHDDCEEIEVQIPEKFLVLFEAAYRFFAFYGGRGGAKSRSFATALISIGQERKIRVLCVREIQNSIRDSVKRILDDEIARQNAGGFFDSNDQRIVSPVNGTEFIFEGLRANSDKIKSYEGIDICWVEEAHTCSQESLDVLEPTIRKPGSQIWYSWNPRNPGDPVHEQFCIGEAPPHSCVVKVNWQDNPWFPQVLYDQMMFMKRKNYKKYLHIWEGEPVGDGGMDVFPVEWVQAAVEVILSDKGPFKAGLDVADDGGDDNVLTTAKGPVVRSIDSWAKGNTTQTARKAHTLLKSKNINRLQFDSIGVGAGVKGEFWSLNDHKFQITAIAVNVGEASTDDSWEPGITCHDAFLNLRAELHFFLRRRFEKTYEYHVEGVQHDPLELISIPNDPVLIKELTQIQYELMDSGKIKIESKKQMLKRGIKSPNKLDSLILCSAKPFANSYLGAI